MTYLEQAQELHQSLTVVDAHHDIAIDLLQRRMMGEMGTLSRYWVPRLQGGGVNVQVLPTFVEDRFLPSLGLREMLRQVDALIEDVQVDNSGIDLITTTTALDAVLASGKVAGMAALEGCDGMGSDPAMLRVFYRIGVRMVAFTWDRRNAFADGTGIENPGGLTAAGRTALKEMFANQVICDVSHLAVPGFWDVMDLAEAPIVASHSNARAVCDHRRNLYDDQIKAIAETGGVIGLNFYGLFVHPDTPTVERMADHLDYMVQLVGIDHVGIGADFLETPIRNIAKQGFIGSMHPPSVLDAWIPNCQEVEQLPRFTAVMLERGYSREEIAKVLGENFLRVFRQVLPA